LVNEFAAADYLPVVVSACEVEEPLEWNGKRPAQALVIRKPNIGYDFGSWAVGLHELPTLAHAPHVVLANDSLVGPFSTIRPLLQRFENSRADVFGLTDTRQFRHHLQSYFLGFSGGILAHAPLRAFFDNIRREPTKWDIIRNSELGLADLLRREAYVSTAAFRADEVVEAGQNPVIKGWWKLLEQGYPFVKREIVRNPAVAPRSEWVRREVLAVFDENVDEWM